MKLNPCKKCGKEPAMYDVSTKSKTIRCMFFQCPNQESIVAEETQAIIGWNAMNPVEEKDEPAKEECGNCRFYDGGKCRRFPATVVHTGSTTTEGWPSVYAHQWCGEWRAK